MDGSGSDHEREEYLSLIHIFRILPGEKGKLPIVAMTANAFAEDVQLAKNTGMNGHIAKPLDMNKLNEVLESWL